jgi:periplasmic protein TonB
MSTSKFCIQQRQREQQQLKKLLILGFTGSALFHGLLAYALPHWSFEPPKQAQEPMELILVDKPKPKPKPKVESKPIVRPVPKPVKAAPVKPPEPVKAETPPPPKPEPVKAETPPPPKPEPVKAETPPPKVLTAPKTAPSQPVVATPAPEPLEPIKPQPSRAVTSAPSNSDRPAVATNTAPPNVEAGEEETDDGGEEGISCVSNCEPEYPGELEGVEGAAGVKLTIDPDGNVVGVELADADDNSKINREALLAARQMQFSSPPGGNAASVRVKIDFTVEGSEYDRLAREEQEKKEQAAKELQEQKLAAEKQAQQERLNREREAKALQEQQQQQQQQQQQITTPKPSTESEPPPVLTESEQERLRKFQDRMRQYQE